MMQRTWKWLAMGLIVQFLGGGAAFAESSAIAEEDQGAPSELTSEENLSLIDEDIEALSSEQKMNRAAKKIDRMRTNLTRVTELLETVRDKERDIFKINCINEKHAAIKGFVKVSEQSYLNLKSATKSGDGAAADHHYTLIAVAHQKVRTLSEEAQLCTGEERRFTGEENVEVVEPESGAEDVNSAEGEEYIIADLPELTPFQ